jgi:hypothetical protein
VSDRTIPARTSAASDALVLPIAFAISCLLVATRRPDALLYPQFFAEDGAWWYAQAHELGALDAIVVPYRNYIHLVPRLAAGLAIHAPMLWAPLVTNAVAVVAQAVTATFLCSRRMARAVPSAWARWGVALLYVGLPGIWGTIANVTNAQWHLAVLACAIVLATPSEKLAWRLFDVAIVALSGLSGPFAIFLLPVVALKWIARRERWSLALGAVAAATALVQAGVILFAEEQAGSRPPLGASIASLLRVVVGRVVYEGLLGQRIYEAIFERPESLWWHPAILAGAALLAAAVVALALARGPLELRLFTLYAALALAAALVWPSKEPLQTTFWENITAPAASNRYFLLPIFALALALFWLAVAPPHSGARSTERFAERAVGGGLLALLLVGAVLDWREPPPNDYFWSKFVAKYDRAPAGAKVQILYPPGWSMLLTKR